MGRALTRPGLFVPFAGRSSNAAVGREGHIEHTSMMAAELEIQQRPRLYARGRAFVTASYFCEYILWFLCVCVFSA